jgi:hypothetical protein
VSDFAIVEKGGDHDTGGGACGVRKVVVDDKWLRGTKEMRSAMKNWADMRQASQPNSKREIQQGTQTKQIDR